MLSSYANAFPYEIALPDSGLAPVAAFAGDPCPMAIQKRAMRHVENLFIRVAP